jgi:hypothetical protein
MITDEQYLEHAKAVWEAIGGYPLTNWKVGHKYLSYVQANGTPPRGKNSRVHVFLFLRKHCREGERNERVVQRTHLCTIIRREWFKSGIAWSSTSGEAMTGKTYRRFTREETEVGKPICLATTKEAQP